MSGYGEQSYGNYSGESQGYGQNQGYYGQQQPQRQYGEEGYNQPPPQRPYGEEGYGQQSHDRPQQHQYGQPAPYGSSEYPPRPEYGQRFEGQEYPPTNAPYGGPNAEGDGDRGVMGALAGGAAGAFGGHKVHHGFLGSVGGAIAGSVLEDQYKKHEHEKKEHELQEQYAHEHQHRGEGPHHGGGDFRASSRDIHIEDRCILVAECANAHGGHFRSAIDLNDCLTNSWGRLEWARRGNFAASAREIRVVDGGAVLEAELDDGNGRWVPNRIWLSEKIINNNGCLEMR